MPRGPKGQKRLRDPAQLAKLIVDIATGEVADDIKPASAASEMGRKGGKARAESMAAERRAEIARKAASLR
jgi:hypothetical protein